MAEITAIGTAMPIAIFVESGSEEGAAFGDGLLGEVIAVVTITLADAPMTVVAKMTIVAVPAPLVTSVVLAGIAVVRRLVDTGIITAGFDSDSGMVVAGGFNSNCDVGSVMEAKEVAAMAASEAPAVLARSYVETLRTSMNLWWLACDDLKISNEIDEPAHN